VHVCHISCQCTWLHAFKVRKPLDKLVVLCLPRALLQTFRPPSLHPLFTLSTIHMESSQSRCIFTKQSMTIAAKTWSVGRTGCFQMHIICVLFIYRRHHTCTLKSMFSVLCSHLVCVHADLWSVPSEPVPGHFPSL